MQFKAFPIVAALIAAPLVSAVGTAFVHNHCDHDVYLWSVDADGSSECITLKSGENHNETIRTPSIGGVSLKLSIDESPADPITQLEYTLTDQLYYDLSNVNCEGDGCPFHAKGMYMESGTKCPTRTCGAMEIPCKGAYTKFNDDWNTVACESQADLTLLLCRDAPMNDDTQTKRAATIEAPKQEYGVPMHRIRKTRRHGHPHWRR